MTARIALPATFDAIGYDEVRGGLPLRVLPTAVPKPGVGELLIHVLWSSLNPLEHKLAHLNFLGRVPPVVLGFDLAGTVAAIGDGVQGFAIGDEVMAMADPTGDGGWAEGGAGGYALARRFMTVAKPAPVSFPRRGPRFRHASCRPSSRSSPICGPETRSTFQAAAGASGISPCRWPAFSALAW